MPHVQEVRAEGWPFSGPLADEEPVKKVVGQDRDLDGIDGFGDYFLHAYSLFSPLSPAGCLLTL